MYRDPTPYEKTWLDAQEGLSQEIYVYTRQLCAVQANIELKQRAFSFIYAAWLAVKTKYLPNEIILIKDVELYKNIENKQAALLQLLAGIWKKIDEEGKNLADSKQFNAFLSEQMLYFRDYYHQ